MANVPIAGLAYESAPHRSRPACGASPGFGEPLTLGYPGVYFSMGSMMFHWAGTWELKSPGLAWHGYREIALVSRGINGPARTRVSVEWEYSG